MLITFCMDKIIENPEPFFASMDFEKMDYQTVLTVVKYDKLPIEEIKIYNALDR